jgi:phage terminase Nu1 subunit (DNA packaging protein)
MGKLVNKTELEQFLGLSHTTLTEYQDQGLPIQKKGNRGEENEYDTAEVVKWLVDRALARAGKSKTVLELELLELQVKEQRAKDALREGSLVPADRVAPIWENRVLSAAFSLTGRASRLAGILEAAQGIEAKRAILKREDEDFLNKLGVDGARMQAVVDEMLGKLAAGEAEAFLRRLAGHDDNEQRGGGTAAAPG